MRKGFYILAFILIAGGQAYAQSITSFTPTSGQVGQTVTITGTGFSATALNNTVYFGATKATVNSASTTSLGVTVPVGATFQPITVTVNGLTAYSSKPFIVTFPSAGGILASSFSIAVPFTTGTSPLILAAGDLDVDGKSDFAVTSNISAGAISILRNTSVSGAASTFATKVDFSPGTSPYGTAIGDLDGDGKLDVAVTNSGSATVSLYRNISTPLAFTTSSFATKVDLATGTTPYSVTIGDIDGDGKPDIIVSNFGSGTISVFRNLGTTGTLSFSTKIDFITQTSPINVAVGDLDGDGKPDIAVANFGSGTLSTFRNSSTSGTISLAARADVSAGTNPNGVAIGDLDGDGRADLAVPNNGSATVSIYRNQTVTVGAISLASRVDLATNTNPNSIAVGDLDGDGKLDLAITATSLTSVSLFRNISTSGTLTSGSFSPKVDFTTGSNPTSVVIADLDNDGKADVATSNFGNTSISVFTNTIPQLIPTITSVSPGSAPIGSTTVTITGTNFSTTAANNIVYFGGVRATVPGSPTSTQLTVTIPSGATAGPISVTVNGLTAYSPKSFIPTYILTSTPGPISFATKTDLTAGTGATVLAAADLDVDGKVDLIVPNNSTTGQLSTLRNTTASGTLSFATNVDFPAGTNPIAAATGDFDGDGKLDVVVANYGSSSVSIFRNTSTTGAISLGPKADRGIGANTNSVAVGDLDGDGKPDIVATTFTAGSITVLMNTSTLGNVSFSNTSFSAAGGTNPTDVAIGDLDGDGKPEIVVTIGGGALVSVFRNGSVVGSLGSTLANRSDFTTGSNPTSVAIGDIDNDGKADLAVTNGTNTVSVYRNLSSIGTVSFAAKVDLTTGTTPTSVSLSDLDADTDLDLVVTASGSNVASVIRNISTSGSITTSSFSSKIDFTTGATPSSSVLADMDGDSKPDLVTSNAANTVSTLLNNTTILLPPTITSFLPASGTVGTSVVITGTNFGSTVGNNTVYFGAIQATVVGVSATQLTVTVPAGANFQPISITANGVTGYSSKPFVVTFPTSGGISASSFATKVDFNAGVNPTLISVADFDGDRKPDFAAPNASAVSASVYQNTSTLGVINAASFAAKVDLTTGTSPFGSAVSDIDGDGKLDLIVVNNATASNSVSILKNISSSGALTASSFAAKVDLVTGSNPYTVAAGDIDGDGKPDIVVSNSGSSTISIFRNTTTSGTIIFAAKFDLTTLSIPSGVAIGDIDGDGKADVVVTNAGSASVSIFRNTSILGTIASSSFATRVDFNTTSTPSFVAIGDIDGDGKSDLAISSNLILSVLRNTSTSGSVSFATRSDFSSLSTSNGLALGDLDGDGKADIAVANTNSASVSVFRNASASGSITLQTRVDFTANSGPIHVVICDFDGDGKSDLAVSNNLSSLISVYLNTVPVLPPTIASFAPASGPAGTSVTLTGTNFYGGSGNIVYFGAVRATVTSTSSTQITATVPVGSTFKPISVTAGGLTGYSAKPFIQTYSSAGGITTGSLLTKVDFATSTTPFALSLGDLDGDLKSDIVVPNNGSQTASVFRNTSTSGAITTASLAAKVDLTMAINPVGSALGDLDGDGKLDLVVTNSSSSSVSVFRNISSSGTLNISSFAARIDLTTGISPYSVAVADIDGDGRPDIIVTNSSTSSNSISIFRNTTTPGAISFAAKVDFSTQSSPSFLAVNDLDGDGKLDIAVTNYTSATVSIFRNVSLSGSITTGSLATQFTLATNSNPYNIAIGDIDGDGKADMVIANSSSSNVSVYRNVSTSGSLSAGSFATKVDFTAGANPNGVALGDLDGDGKLEMAVTNSTASTVSVFRNTSTSGTIASSSFATKVDFLTGAQPFSVAIGDIDGDTKSDLVVANSASGTISVFMNAIPILPPTITSFTPAFGPSGATVTITGTNFNTTAASNIVYFGAVRAAVTAATATQLTVTVPVGATYQIISATTGNLTAYSSKPFIPVFNSGGGINANSFAAASNAAVGVNPFDAAIADINLDGKPDLAVTNRTSGSISLLGNSSTSGTLAVGSNVDFVTGALPNEMAIGDIDGDGDLDFAVAGYNSNVISLFQNLGASTISSGSLSAKVDLTASTGPAGIALGDLDGDGKPDLVASNSAGFTISIFRNTSSVGAISTSSFASKVDISVGSGVAGDQPTSVAIGDLDSDGKPDLAIPNAGNGSISILRNTSTQGSISFASKVEVTTGSAPLRVAIGDLDGDGKQDMAIVYLGSATSVYRNTSTSGSISFTFTGSLGGSVGSNPAGVAMGDLDGDGRLDVVSSNAVAGTVSLYQNTSSSGTITFASKFDLTAGTNPAGVRIGDLDGDGKPEVIVQNYNTNSSSPSTISVFLNTTPVYSITNQSFPDTFVRGSTVKISITLSGTSSSTVKFWSRGISDAASASTSQTVTPTANKYEVTLQNTNFTDAIGITYYFEIGSGNYSPTGYTYIQYPTTLAEQAIPSINFGSTLSNYQIISIPLTLTDNSVTKVFNSLGAYDKKKWRLYTYANGATSEYPSGTITPGNGYWLIVKNSTVINPGEGTTTKVTSAAPFTISLAQGWNLIGNPYNFKLSWQDILTYNGSPTTIDTPLRLFSAGALANGTVIDKYRGAFVHTTAATTLKIPVLKNTTIGRIGEIAENTNELNQPDWEVRLGLTDGELSNQLGALGMNPKASLAKDAFDEESLPLPDGLGLFEVEFRQPGLSTTFDKDYVPTNTSHIWDFSVLKGTNGNPITMTWANNYFGNNGKQMVLFDVALGAAVDMRTITEYKLQDQSSKMKIAYGDKEFVDNFLDESLPLIGTTYPNPAAERVTIPFRISKNMNTAPVSIVVYDSNGRLISTLVNKEYVAGSYEVKWDHNESPGLYCIQTRVGTTQQLQKIIIK